MQKSKMAVPPPPPPAPTSPSSSAPKINRKTVIALGVIIIIVVALVVGVILATRGGGGGKGGNVADASSLQFSADITVSGTLATYTYYAKNIGTSNAMLRVEWTSSEGNYIYIINGAQKQAWVEENGTWTDLSDYFSETWNTWNSTFAGMTSSLSHWSGSGDYTNTDPSTGDTIRIYNISVNPSLADSLFEHS